LEQLWDATLLVLGAGIAAITTYLFNRSLEYKDRKKLANSLFVKAFMATNDVSGLRRDLSRQMEDFKSAHGRYPGPHEAWTAVRPFVGLKHSEVSFSGEELSLFEGDAESIGKLLEFLSIRQVLLDSAIAYGEKRLRLSDALAALTKFRNVGDDLIGTTEVNLSERPDLHQAISETNKLCKDILELADTGETYARRICDLVNQKVPSKFRNGDFKLRMELPRADA
jgi:hypothetical protein